MSNFQNFLFPEPDATMTAEKLSTYSTRSCMSMDNGQPVTGVQVGISANNVTSMFINHLYYVVGPAPIHVKTDAVG
jgi:hypothetical protein